MESALQAFSKSLGSRKDILEKNELGSNFFGCDLSLDWGR